MNMDKPVESIRNKTLFFRFSDLLHMLEAECVFRQIIFYMEGKLVMDRLLFYVAGFTSPAYVTEVDETRSSKRSRSGTLEKKLNSLRSSARDKIKFKRKQEQISLEEAIAGIEMCASSGTSIMCTCVYCMFYLNID